MDEMIITLMDAKKPQAKMGVKKLNNIQDEVDEILKSMLKDIIEKILESEMDELLGYEKKSTQMNKTGNSRNGYNKKRLKTRIGRIELRVPRDRRGLFVPKLIEKYQTKANDLEQHIIPMYARGFMNHEIIIQLKNLYGADASGQFIHNIMGKIMPSIEGWRSRPLKSVYPLVFFDGLNLKINRVNRVLNKNAIMVVAINENGVKEILGMWVVDKETTNFWIGVCTDLKQRGVNDIYIACRDGSSEISSAIKAIFPKTEQQFYINRQIRTSMKNVSYRDLKNLILDLKRVYQAKSVEDAVVNLEALDNKWGGKYPQLIQSWMENRTDLSAYYKYSEDIRHIIYSTNAVDGFQRVLNKKGLSIIC